MFQCVYPLKSMRLHRRRRYPEKAGSRLSYGYASTRHWDGLSFTDWRLLMAVVRRLQVSLPS